MPTINYLEKRPRVACDIEVLPNFFAIGFRNVDDGRTVKISMFEDEALDRKRIASIVRNNRLYTFNGNGFDMPILALAMTGATCAELKRASDEIILTNLRSWQFFDKYEVTLPDFLDHIDLMEVAPAAAQRFSLKKYAGTMHSRTMMEFEHDFNQPLDEDQVADCLSYLDNDLEVTCELVQELTPQLALRSKISADHNFDFRSKSDAQCGEAVVKLLVEKRTGKRLYKPDIKPGLFNYTAPAYIEFQTPYMQKVLSDVLRSPFRVKSDGYVLMPDVLEKRDIVIGNGVYRMGIGGLHSSESKVSHHSTPTVKLKDRDVTSYYPFLMIRSGREPANMRGHFRAIFQSLVNERVAAKKAGDKSKAESLKIFINGLFGKTGSPYSIVYSPEMMIQTTISGQLSILMLIEAMELSGFQVVSANTDGFVTLVPDDRAWLFEAIIFDWECASGLLTEETVYESLHSRDVNNYLALYRNKDGSLGVKRKGAYSPSGRGIPGGFGLKKTPDCEICSEAAIAFLMHGTPVETTVRNCQDIRKFVTVRLVTGGAQKDGKPIGKNVRYYYADDNPGPLTYLNNGNRVPSSEGAEPCMVLPDELPGNIDYERYEREAYAILDDMGVDVPDPTLVGRSGFVLGHRDDQKTVHTVDAATGVALCGADRKSRRDSWVEVEDVGEEMRGCAKCRRAGDL